MQHKKLGIGLAALAMLGATTVGAQEPPRARGIRAEHGCGMLCLEAADDGRTVHLRQGELMMISLVANPSTGTAWHIEALDSAVVVPLCEAFSAFRPDLVGSAGLSHGFYQATQPGETSLELLYYRDWEGPSTATARFTVTVVVD